MYTIAFEKPEKRYDVGDRGEINVETNRMARRYVNKKRKEKESSRPSQE